MSDSKRSKVVPQPPTSSSDTRPAGRIVHDDRGNAVWDWRKESNRLSAESTSGLLRRLEIPDLAVEDSSSNSNSSPNAKQPAAPAGSTRDPGGGYDPYNQSSVPRRPPGRKP